MPARSRTIERASVQRFAQLFPHELAVFADTLPADQVAELIEGLPPVDAAAVFRRLRPDSAADVLDRLADETLSKLVSKLDPGPVAAILARLDSDRRNNRLQALSESHSKEITQLMTYTSDSAGGIMDPRVTTFRPSSTVNEVIKRIRSLRSKRISDVFLIDEDGKLVGAVSLQDLVLAQSSDTLDELVGKQPVSVQATASREQVLEVFALSNAPSVPVTVFEGRVVGVIRHESLMAAAQAEATADVQTMVGASKDERALSKVSFAVRRRLPWLQVNLGTAFLAAAVVGLFEGTIAQFTALAVLLPVVAGQSGNTGSQALAV
ncbi:MAG: CBS domain-containing protein, partial [Gemmatimonadales bacterium]